MPRMLTFLQLEDLYDDVLSNAFNLSQDARLLLEANSIGHARALAILALEECGKAIMIHQAKIVSFHNGDKDPILDERFWKDWRTHQPKLRAVHDFIIREEYWFDTQPPPINELLLGNLSDYLAELDRWAANGDSSKLRGLYVDINHGTGNTVSPAADSGADEVEELLAIAHQIGWQIRLGDHIQFIAAVRHDDTIDPDNLYSAYADGGALAGSRSGGRGWEAQRLELMQQMAGYDREREWTEEH